MQLRGDFLMEIKKSWRNCIAFVQFGDCTKTICCGETIGENERFAMMQVYEKFLT